MTSETTPPTHGQIVSAALQPRTDHQRDSANRRATELKMAERDENGRIMAKITPDQWDWVIERVAMGDSDLTLTQSLGVSVGSIAFKRKRDADFATRYNDAVAEAFVNVAKDIQKVTRGEPGYSSGDVRRDELIAKYDLELAKRFARKVIGDHMTVDQRQIVINLPPELDNI